MAERIARIVGLDICGIDVMAPDVNTPITENGVLSWKLMPHQASECIYRLQKE
jgi:glutathione synthase/RimK-type ligase-like ATP-grasp enzyme